MPKVTEPEGGIEAQMPWRTHPSPTTCSVPPWEGAPEAPAAPDREVNSGMNSGHFDPNPSKARFRTRYYGTAPKGYLQS